MHPLRSRKELSGFLSAGILRRNRLKPQALKRYLSSFGPGGVCFPGHPLTDRGRAYGLRYIEEKDEGKPDLYKGRSGIQIKVRQPSFPFTLVWCDIYFPKDLPFLKQFISMERVFCDGALFMLDHPD